VVTISASVSSASGTPFGGATFFDGSALLGTAALHADGTATFSTAGLSAGTHNLSASFNANATFAGSSSAPVTLAVNAPPASAIATFTALSTTLHSDDGTASLTATVTAEHGSPHSTVVFLDGGVILGKAITDSMGSAVLTLPLPGNGAHNLQASFSGDSQFAASASPELQEIWPASGPGFSIAVNSSVVRFSGDSAEAELSLTSLSAIQNPIQLACASGVPAGYSCSFEPSTLSQGGISHLTIRRSAPSSNALFFDSGSKTRILSCVVVVLFVVLFTASRLRVPALAALCCLGLFFVSGCGGSIRQPEKLQVVTIQATSATGQSLIVHSAQFILVRSDR
jgi:hypothetical protein